MHEVGQPRFLHRGYRAAWQRAEGLEINGLRTHFDEKRVQKILMAELVISVLRDVRGHIVIDCFERINVGTVHVGKLGVLLPQIGLEDFRGSEEAQNVRIPSSDRICLVTVVASPIGQSSSDRENRCPSNGKVSHKKSSWHAVPATTDNPAFTN